ncbi:uncharacterized protein LOC144104522 isoform X2 [Amblyomma americanum]
MAEDFELNSSECGVSGSPHLIVNGTAARPGQFPWMVRLSMVVTEALELFCGGAIITKRHVLTAAHCLSNNKGEMATRGHVYYGSHDVKQAKMVEIEKMFPHLHFKRKPWTHDIAILLVKEPFQYSEYVRPLCLPTGKLDDLSKEVVAAGWGHMKPNGSAVKGLQYTNVKVVPGKMCREYGENWTESQMLCTFKPGSGVCNADSGGPLFLPQPRGRYVQVGIASFVAKPGCVIHPQVFTRVDVFMPWIKKHIGKHGAYVTEKTNTEITDGDGPAIPDHFTMESRVHPHAKHLVYPPFDRRSDLASEIRLHPHAKNLVYPPFDRRSDLASESRLHPHAKHLVYPPFDRRSDLASESMLHPHAKHLVYPPFDRRSDLASESRLHPHAKHLVYPPFDRRSDLASESRLHPHAKHLVYPPFDRRSDLASESMLHPHAKHLVYPPFDRRSDLASKSRLHPHAKHLVYPPFDRRPDLASESMLHPHAKHLVYPPFDRRSDLASESRLHPHAKHLLYPPFDRRSDLASESRLHPHAKHLVYPPFDRRSDLASESRLHPHVKHLVYPPFDQRSDLASE